MDTLDKKIIEEDSLTPEQQKIRAACLQEAIEAAKKHSKDMLDLYNRLIESYLQMEAGIAKDRFCDLIESIRKYISCDPSPDKAKEVMFEAFERLEELKALKEFFSLTNTKTGHDGFSFF